MKQVLTIAGHDLSGGAGMTKDLELFSSLGLHGLSVPTSLVIQGPSGVRRLEPVSLPAFTQMLAVVKDECRVEGVKIGAIVDKPHAEAISGFLKTCGDIPVVVDPVLSAKNGYPLLSPEGLAALILSVFPFVTVVTPNAEEGEQISGIKALDLPSMKSAAEKIVGMGPKGVVIKGGHLPGEPLDMLFDGKDLTTWKRKRVDKVIHGTGCAFSSLMLSFLALGFPLREAFYETETILDRMLLESFPLGSDGSFYTSLSTGVSRDAERWQVLAAMAEAEERLCQMDILDLIPAVQMNMGYAVRNAKGIEEVVAFPGRISSNKGRLLIKGKPEFGASSHVARLILAYMKYYPSIRAAVSIRYSAALIKIAEGRGLSAICADRIGESEELKKQEGKSLDFLVDKALSSIDYPPDIIYDCGDVGKEPIIRLFARNPEDLLNKMETLHL